MTIRPYRVTLTEHKDQPRLTGAIYYRLGETPDEAVAQVPMAPYIDVQPVNWKLKPELWTALTEMLAQHRRER